MKKFETKNYNIIKFIVKHFEPTRLDYLNDYYIMDKVVIVKNEITNRKVINIINTLGLVTHVETLEPHFNF
jgi:hypothetical protein